MKIAYFVYNLDFYSGAALQALELSKNIDHDIIFFNFRGSKYKKHSVESKLVIDVPANKIYAFIIIFINILKYRIQVLHLHGMFPLGLLTGWILRKKIILKTTLLGKDDFLSISKSRYARLKMFLLRKIHLNVVLSETLKKINSGYLGSEKVVKIYNGVVLDPQGERTTKTNTFCFVGLICKRKRPYESIEYFIKNYSKLEGAKLILVGPYKDVINNTEFDEVYVRKCFELVEKNGMEGKIIFTGNISKKETFNVYKQSKALLFFSMKEGLPNSVLEAMSNNCVPVLSEMDGVSKEILGDNQGGFVLEDLEEKISLDAIDEKIRARLPVETVRERFDIRKIAKRYETIYEKLLLS